MVHMHASWACCVLFLVCMGWLVGEVGATVLPGMKGFADVEVWEGSKDDNVFTMVTEYILFRSHAFQVLSDLGWFDHLLECLPQGETLRDIEDFGLATGFACLLIKETAREALLTRFNTPAPARAGATAVWPHLLNAWILNSWIR